LGASTKTAQGQWVININDSDNRASWAAVAAPVFRNNPKAARQYLSERFVFNEAELGEINAALSTGDLSRLSTSTRRSLANVQRGFGNQITAAEILQKQANRYFDGTTPPVFRENALKIQGAIRAASGGGGTKPVDASIIITNWSHAHSKRPGGSGNNAIDFTIQRQNGQISNPVPAPFSGTIVSSGYERGGFGNSVIIRADSDGPGYRKGDLVRLAHLAATYYQPGQRIRRGMPIGKSGDSSRHDSRPGYSGTGAGDPGHVHIQLYRPNGATQQFQYGQETQNTFVRKSYLPLFRSN
jgi:murein DD-endopeptidase MepM/ murein hydrolase activator NlpD